jgi:hypothetical protein
VDRLTVESCISNGWVKIIPARLGDMSNLCEETPEGVEVMQP